MTFATSKSRYHAAETLHAPEKRPWRTGFWRRAPVYSLLALLTALLCGIALAIVLIASDGLPVGGWRLHGYSVQPAVLLSVLATIANALLRYAFTNGATTFWWTRALDGATIRELHQCWSSGQSSFNTTIPSKQSITISLASFCTLLLLIDGPFLQRASSVTTAERRTHRNLTLPVSPSPFVQYATGIYATDATFPNLFNPVFADVVQQYNNRRPIHVSGFGCEETCQFDIVAAGWDIQCKSWSSPFRLMSVQDYLELEYNGYPSPTSNQSYTGPAKRQTMFWSNVTFGAEADEMLEMLVQYRSGKFLNLDYGAGGPQRMRFSSMVKSTPNGNGTLDWRDCYLQEAVQKYPVSITNNTITLRPMPVLQNFTEYPVFREEIAESSGQDYQGSTAGGLWLAMKNAFQGSAHMKTDGLTVKVSASNGVGLTYLKSPNVTALSKFAAIWEDPLDDMISMVRELSLRTAIVTTHQAPGAPATPGGLVDVGLSAPQSDIYVPNLTSTDRSLFQHVVASVTYSEVVYQSHFGWLGGAVALIVLAFITILPTFHKWWQLGRVVSLSPVEIAHAFEAQLLDHADSNATAEDLVRELGDLPVRYGTSTMGEKEAATTEGHPEDVSRVGVQVHGKGFERRRLAFARLETVDEPQSQETFANDDEIREQSQSCSRRPGQDAQR